MRSQLVTLCLALVVAACAKGSVSSGSPDGGEPILTDGSSDASLPDAAPGAPDAAPFVPDARPGTPDARPADGAVPDASLPVDARTTVDAGPVDSGSPDSSSGTCNSPCELVSQCGCPADQACDLDNSQLATGGRTCRVIITPGTETSTCNGISQCAAGYTCVSGVCRKYCADDTRCTGPGGVCTQLTYDSTNPKPIPGGKVCSANCDPLTGTGCPNGWGCNVYQDDNDRFFTECRPAGSSGQDAACLDNEDCQAGFTCVNIDILTRACLRNCNAITGAGCNASDPVCYSFVTPVKVGNTTYGVCDN
ncbi:MAG: hypothetical protein HY698_18100 [Deltaproteobacteria bacterium]|nr:hypothetical protein [Deltaproteobacteria bacterium]